MRKLAIISCVTLFINCQGLVQKQEEEIGGALQDNVESCSEELRPVIEIWNHTGDEFIIGDWGKREDSYLKSDGWNTSDSPYPKKFDLKLIIVNNRILYDNPVSTIEDWHLSVRLRFKVGQNQNAVYPLNGKVFEGVDLIGDRLITNEDFTNSGQVLDHIEIWQRNIDIETFYHKYRNEGLFINQLIFDIHLTSKDENVCNYEYIFPMTGIGEP